MIVIRNFFLLLLLLVLNFSIRGQKTAPQIKTKSFYQLFNSLYTPDTNKRILLSNLAANKNLLEDTDLVFKDSIFSIEDKTFMRSQLKSHLKFKWKKGKLDNVDLIRNNKIRRILNKPEGWKKFHSRIGQGYIQYSIPIFSIDGQYCVLYHSSNCGGLCGGGGTHLYKKEGEKWIYVKWYSLWIS